MSTLDSSSSDLNRTVLSSVTAIDSTSIPVSKAICDTNTFCTHVPHTSKHTKNQSTYIDTSHSRDQCDTTLSGIERLSHKRTWSEDLTTNEQYHGSKTYKLTVNDDAHSFYSHDDLDPSQVDSDDSHFFHQQPSVKQTGEESIDEDEDPKTKRKVQNRAAQRAFRERKERYVKDLEMKIKQIQETHVFTTHQLFRENQHLRSVVYRLESENFALKGAQTQISDINSACHKPNTLQEGWLPPTAYKHSFSYPVEANMPSMMPRHPSGHLLYTTMPLMPIEKEQISHANIAPVYSQLPSSSPPTYSPLPFHSHRPVPMPVPILPQQTQPPAQKFTFTISTPATLKANGVAGHQKKLSPEPVRPVRLYAEEQHPAMQPRKQPQLNSTANLNYSQEMPDNENFFGSPVSMDIKNTRLAPSQGTPSPLMLLRCSAMETCDTLDSFANTRHSSSPFLQQHHSVSDSLLEKPLLDDKETLDLWLMGKHSSASPDYSTLSPTLVIQHPIGREVEKMKEKSKNHLWQRLIQSDRLSNYSVDQLLEGMKRRGQCVDTGRFPDDWEMDKLMRDIDQEHL